MTKRWLSHIKAGEAKSEATNTAAKLLIDAETFARQAKIERRRTAPLGLDAPEPHPDSQTVTRTDRQSCATPMRTQL